MIFEIWLIFKFWMSYRRRELLTILNFECSSKSFFKKRDSRIYTSYFVFHRMNNRMIRRYQTIECEDKGTSEYLTIPRFIILHQILFSIKFAIRKSIKRLKNPTLTSISRRYSLYRSVDYSSSIFNFSSRLSYLFHHHLCSNTSEWLDCDVSNLFYDDKFDYRSENSWRYEFEVYFE